jgi:hypothetical protein
VRACVRVCVSMCVCVHVRVFTCALCVCVHVRVCPAHARPCGPPEPPDSPPGTATQTWGFLWSAIKQADLFVSHPVPNFIPDSVPLDHVVCVCVRVCVCVCVCVCV